MIRFIIRRVLASIPLVWALATLTFFIIRLAPGDPMAMYFNPEIDPSVMETVRVRLGLDQPLHVQYVKWLGALAQGEFGVSFSHHRPVAEILAETVPNTLILTFLALLLDLVVGVAVGLVSAARQYSWIDNVLTLGALFVYSMPGFWLGLVLIIVFSLKLGILPASQMASVDAEYMAFLPRLWDRALHLVLPVFVLGIASAASVARFMRGSLLEVIRQDYIRTARAKGLPERVVVFRHALRNALIPLVTLLGLYIPFLMSGAVVTETIFAWPGMGRLTVGAIFARDYPVVMAVNLIAGVMVVGGNLIADVLYAVVDPRIRYE
ncbi:MAG: ABC transporter permease [Gemmatimonadota bacterium]|jgi:peptide/nickel transport system permease protein|nr:ABC transporter permease [Gemmatimonadota bacterium]MDP6802313.1 ABC transporter permease [Gemmatimonadota bacterium]MDP7031953.1 ABC transporter permease [Gemmatimonadota bacterium]